LWMEVTELPGSGSIRVAALAASILPHPAIATARLVTPYHPVRHTPASSSSSIAMLQGKVLQIKALDCALTEGYAEQ
jgi:hypothetical protein